MTDSTGHNLREVNAGSKPPIWWRTLPLIRVRSGQPIVYAQTPNEKLIMLRDQWRKGDQFIVPWPGKWSTDVFAVTEEVRHWWIAVLSCPGGKYETFSLDSKKPWDK